MKSRIIRKNDKCYVELPEEFLDVEELEITPARQGIYLLTFEKIQKAQSKPQSSESIQLTEPERAVLKKLITIKFENRTPAFVSSSFSENEKQTIKDLERKKYITVFYGSKYKQTGVYNINDNVFPHISERKNPQNPEPQKKETPTSLPTNGSSLSPMDLFLKNGFVVISDQKQAYDFSELTKKQGKQNSLFGVKAFDGKFYVASRRYFEKFGPLVKSNLDEDRTAQELALKCKTEPEGCAVVLHLLSEKGEVIEKRKGMFSLA